jgi:hypothetical protein
MEGRQAFVCSALEQQRRYVMYYNQKLKLTYLHNFVELLCQDHSSLVSLNEEIIFESKASGVMIQARHTRLGEYMYTILAG